MEFRTFDFEVEEARQAEEDNIGRFKGVANAFGVVDDYGSVFDKGAFKKTLNEQEYVPVAWFHAPDKSIGSSYMEEQSEGLQVTDGRVNLDTQRGREIFSGMNFDPPYVTEMSIGFDTIQSETDGEGIEHKKEAKLYEVSLLTKNFAANPGASVDEVLATSRGIQKMNKAIKMGAEEKLREALDELRELLSSSEILTVSEFRIVPSYQDLPLADRDRDWTKSEAVGRLRDYAGVEDEPNEQYRKFFFYWDPDKKDDLTGGTFPYADIINGEPHAVPNALFSIVAYWDRTDISDSAKDEIRPQIKKYYKKMRNKWDDFDERPFEEESIEELLEKARNDIKDSIARLEGGSRGTTSGQGSPQNDGSAGYDPQIVEEIKRAKEEIEVN